MHYGSSGGSEESKDEMGEKIKQINRPSLSDKSGGCGFKVQGLRQENETVIESIDRVLGLEISPPSTHQKGLSANI